MMYRFINLLAIVLVLIGCSRQKPPTPKPAGTDQPAFQTPTAAEVFNLRTKCAELGEKINGEYDFASPGNVTFKLPFIKQEELSHYDPKTNRCYVELRVHVNDSLMGFMMVAPKHNAMRSKMKDGLDDFLKHYDLAYIERHLYDGQTGEELASSQNGLKGVTPTGYVKGRLSKVEWFDAANEMDNLMADDRKR
jgi:hypothetical protein